MKINPKHRSIARSIGLGLATAAVLLVSACGDSGDSKDPVPAGKDAKAEFSQPVEWNEESAKVTLELSAPKTVDLEAVKFEDKDNQYLLSHSEAERIVEVRAKLTNDSDAEILTNGVTMVGIGSEGNLYSYTTRTSPEGGYPDPVAAAGESVTIVFHFLVRVDETISIQSAPLPGVSVATWVDKK